MNTDVEILPKAKPTVSRPRASTAFGVPRDFLGNRFIYAVISPRARGLSIGVNLNPDKACNFDCIYCEVDRQQPTLDCALDTEVMAAELEATLTLINGGGLRGRAPYATLPESLLQLRHVALSGDGEPTLCPDFLEAVEAIVHLRAKGRVPFFKIVLLTNATRLDAAQVQDGLRLFTRDDEIWAKLDVGTQAQMNLVNKSEVPIEKILSNILLVARQRPVVIQSLFPAVNGHAPSEQDIEQYAQRLKELATAGAQILLVQVYSATRPTVNPQCGHLPLGTLSRIAQTVRSRTGLNVEIF